MNTGCEERIDPPAVNSSEGKTVEVTLNLGIANEKDGTAASTSPTSKTGSSIDSQSAFEVVPVSEVHTKATGDVPDKLYNLDIIQYTSSGSTVSATISEQLIGTAFAAATVKLTQDTGSKLLLVARGITSGFSSLKNKTLSQVQDLKVKAKGSNIEAIATNATGNGLANMPYYLYLENVNITSDGKIESPEGKDVRLMLKRLAVKLTVDWTFNETLAQAGYTLKEVKLCQVPADYRLIPKTEDTDKWGKVYPTSVAEFVDVYRLTGTELDNANGSKTVWIPANARGTSLYASSPIYRNKTNANPAATYMEFVVDNSSKKERLYYRAYLGGNETTDFNLLENTNYHWTVNINNASYTTDPRIQLLDQTPVISTNLQPTANCFMMRPGTKICFNPYKHDAGTDGWNTHLTSSEAIQSGKEITKVEVLWQTKDAGTSGDLVMGYVVNATNHQNLVNLTDGADIKNARIHVKVPNTNGGNALIAAYNNNTIVWSWHIWISDYVPTRINHFSEYESAQQSSINGTVHKYDSPLFQSGGVYADKVMMDRDLGARKGGFPSITIGNSFTTMDIVNTFGMLYQCGRKDPFFPSADGTNNETDIIYDGDGLTIGVDKTNARATMQAAIANPLKFYYYNGAVWNTESDRNKFWNAEGGSAPGKKTIYDPCPKGWKVPNIFANNSTNIETNSIYTNFRHKTASGEYDKFLYYYNDSWNSSVPDDIESNPKGGRLFLIGNTTLNTTTIHNSVWIPAGAERNGSTEEETYKGNLSFAGKYGHLWGAESTGAQGYFLEFKPSSVSIYTYYSAYGWSVRCIQQ